MSISSQPGNSRFTGRHKEALDLMAQGMVRDAVLILVDLADADPNNHFVCVDLGRAVLKMGLVDQAVMAARQAIELDSRSVEAFQLLAEAQEVAGNFKDANVALRRAIDILRDPGLSEEDLLKERVPLPIVFPEKEAIFILFELAGDVTSLAINSTTQDKKSAFVLHLDIAGGGQPFEKAGYEVDESGSMPRDKVLGALPDDVLPVVKIFPAAEFNYTLLRKVEK